MSEEEKIAEAARLAEEAAEAAKDPLAERDARIAKLEEERDNYKNVALKRLGKLPADSEFLGEAGADINALIEDRVKAALVDREITLEAKAKDDEIKRMVRENSELRLLVKNRPGGGTGGEGGSGQDVKDNVFSAEQLVSLRAKAIRLKADPEKFIERAKQNLLTRK